MDKTRAKTMKKKKQILESAKNHQKWIEPGKEIKLTKMTTKYS